MNEKHLYPLGMCWRQVPCGSCHGRRYIVVFSGKHPVEHILFCPVSGFFLLWDKMKKWLIQLSRCVIISPHNCWCVWVCVSVTVTDTNPMLSLASSVWLCTWDETMSQVECEKNNCFRVPGKNACTQKSSHVGVSHKRVLGSVAKGTILIWDQGGFVSKWMFANPAYSGTLFSCHDSAVEMFLLAQLFAFSWRDTLHGCRFKQLPCNKTFCLQRLFIMSFWSEIFGLGAWKPVVILTLYVKAEGHACTDRHLSSPWEFNGCFLKDL